MHGSHGAGGLESVLRLSARKKKSARELADWIAAYGFPPGLGIDFERYYGLWLHIPRVLAKQSVAVMNAHGWMNSPRDIPVLPFDAVASSEEQAEEMRTDANFGRAAERAMAKARSKAGF